MLRRLTLTAVASLAVLSAAAPAATAVSPLVPLPPLPVLQGDWPTARDTTTRLTVTVSESGNPAADGVFELECNPAAWQPPRRAARLRPAGRGRRGRMTTRSWPRTATPCAPSRPMARPPPGSRAPGRGGRRRAFQPGQRL